MGENSGQFGENQSDFSGKSQHQTPQNPFPTQNLPPQNMYENNFQYLRPHEKPTFSISARQNFQDPTQNNPK